MANKILILEDDFAINHLLTQQLKTEGFEVVQSYNGEEALDLFDNSIDLAILDIMVPKINGVTVMKKIRYTSMIPIIFLTAKDEEIDKIRALGLGADDYITKPFSMIEVIYRIKGQIRRFYEYNQHQETDIQTLFTHGDLQLNVIDCILTINGQMIDLGVKEFELLTFFMRHIGQVFTKHQLYEQVWGEEFHGDDNTVMVHISKLREKIGDSSKNPKYIKTIKGLGYRMESL